MCSDHRDKEVVFINPDGLKTSRNRKGIVLFIYLFFGRWGQQGRIAGKY
jgi:hypothetical protein